MVLRDMANDKTYQLNGFVSERWLTSVLRHQLDACSQRDGAGLDLAIKPC